jgi:hypothetical protein
MTRRTLPLLLVVATVAAGVLAAAAQPPLPQRPGRQVTPPRAGPRAADEQPRGTAIVRGTIVAADTGSPIRRAQVRLSGAGVPGRVAVTDAQGRFELRELPAGRYNVSASKAGFVGLQYGQRRPNAPGTPIDVADAQVIDKITVALPRGSVLSGRITDEFGEPIANASVTAMRDGYSGGARRLLPAGGNGRDTTDDQGAFRLFGLPPGDYVVSATVRAADATDPAGETPGYAPTYFPGTPSPAEAQRVAVAIGQEQHGVSFALVATKLVRVTGAVLNSQGGPLTAGVVTLVPPGGMGAALTQTNSGRIDASGQFRITNVAPGRYIAQVRSAPPRGQQDAAQVEFGRQEIAVGAEDLHGVVLMTGPGARVAGRIVSDTGTPPDFNPRQMQVGARVVNPDQSTPLPGGNARVNDDWSFEVAQLFDARVFRVNLPPEWGLKAVTWNGQDITDTPVEFPPGQTSTGLEIVVTQKLSAVSGRVVDTRGAPATDATVVVFPADEATWMPQSRYVRGVRTDAQGGFQIVGLPANDRYLIVAVQGLETGQASDPEFLASVADEATRFSLIEGESKTIELRPRIQK